MTLAVAVALAAASAVAVTVVVAVNDANAAASVAASTTFTARGTTRALHTWLKKTPNIAKRIANTPTPAFKGFLKRFQDTCRLEYWLGSGHKCGNINHKGS